MGRSTDSGWVRLQRMLAVLSLLLVSLGALPGMVSAQRGDDDIDEDMQDAGVLSDSAWESPQFGASVTWDGDWELVDDPEWTFSDPDLAMDALALGTDTLYFSVTYVESPAETPEEYMDRVVDLRLDGVEDYEEVSRDDSDEASSLVYTGTDGGDLYVAVTEVSYFDEDDGILRMAVLNAWEDEIVDGFNLAQDGIEVEGDAPFQVIDVDDLDGDGASSNGDDANDQDDADDGPNQQDDADDDPDQQDDADDADDGPNVQDNNDDDRDDADQEALGLVGRREYVSPQFDLELSWGRAWTVMDDYLVSNTEDGQDNIALIDSDESVVQVTILANDVETPAAYLDRVVEFRSELDNTADLAVLDEGEVGNRAYVIYLLETTEGKQIYELIEVGEYDDGVLFKVEMQANPGNAEDAFDVIQDEIELDGESPFLFADVFPEAED